MQKSTSAGMLIHLTLFLGLGLTGMSARAAHDYEYARGLLKMETRRFETQDLVEHLLKRLAKSSDSNAQLEGKLIEATLRRQQAKYASPEKRNELLTKASALYKEFMEKGKSHRLFKECESEQSTIQLDHARTLVKSAEENPTGSNKDRMTAVAIFEKIANEKEALSKAARPLFEEKLKAIREWFNKNPDKEMAPQSLISPAQKALENYIPKDKMYIIARMEQVGAYPDGEVKKTKAHELIEYCKKQVESEDIGQLQDVCMWYHFIKGRLHSMIVEEEKASESWRNALDINIESFPKAIKETVFGIKKLIYRDLVLMKERAAKTNPQKYNEIIEIVRSAKYEPAMKSLFDESVGKDLLIRYAEALTKQRGADSGDYEQAIKELKKIVDKGPPWSNNASRAMASILSRARVQKVKPRLSAREWYGTARGFFLDGQLEYLRFKENENGDPPKAQKHYEEACEKYSHAVEYYRRAIGQARNLKATELSVRLKVEPQAWFEMGLAYLKMKHYRESVIAYKALESTFAKDFRKKWLPDPKKDSRFYKNKAVKEALDNLDKINKADPREDGVLNRTNKNIKISAGLLAREKTPWAKKRKITILSEGGLGDDDSNDVSYQAGKLALEAAKDLTEQGHDFLGKKKKVEAEKQFLQALNSFVEAGAKFEKVKKTSNIYEIGLYQAASCYTYAQSLASDEHKIVKAFTDEQRLAKVRELGKKALDWYEKYEQHVAATKDNSEEVVARRMKLGRGTKLNRTTVYYGMKDWEGVLKACQDFMDFEKKSGQEPDESKFQKIYFNMFRAYSYIAGGKEPPACDEYIEKAAALLPKLESNPKFYAYALGNISHRYNNAASKAEAKKLGREVLNNYDMKVAEYQALAMKLKEEPTIDDYGRLLYLYERTGRKQEAADIAATMLKRFDPENKNARIEDSQWPGLLKAMFQIIKYNDLNKWDRCKVDHKTLLDFVYDTDEGLRWEHDASKAKKLPEGDKHPVDYDKAANQIKIIKKKYADCPTVKPIVAKHKFKGGSYLSFIEDEVEFRRRIIATRDLLSDVALEVAKTLDEQDGQKERANHYRQLADEQIEILLGIYGNVPSMKLKSANIKFSNGDYDGAIKMFIDIKNPEPPTSDLYIKASKRISETYMTKGDYHAAARYPSFIAATAGLDSNWVKKWWPDMKKFLEKCYENGVPRPKEVAVANGSGGNQNRWESKSEDEKMLQKLEKIKLEAERNADMRSTLITPEFVMRYKFFKGKVEHFSEYKKLERLLLHHQGQADEKEVLTDNFHKRYKVIKELVGVETEFWKAFIVFSEAIVEHKGVDKVPSHIKSKKDQLKTKVDKLRAELNDLPEVKAIGNLKG